MKNALIRVDGSVKIGLGHLMRCLGLARGLEKAGINSVFVSKSPEPFITGLIQRQGFQSQLLASECNLKQDGDLMLHLAEQYDAGIIATDLCNEEVLADMEAYLVYLKNLKQHIPCLITIDDLSVADFASDIVINPNYGAENSGYPRSNHTRYLLGPAYFIFRQEFIEAALLERTIRREARNILVSMGGSDLLNLTFKVVTALSKISGVEGLSLRIMPGLDSSPERMKVLKEALRNFKGTFKFCSTDSNIADLMLWADLAITGGGLTKYETAVTGIPSIIVPQVRHQAELSSLFAREGSALYLGYCGEINEEKLAESVKYLLKDYNKRVEMSIRGRKLVDGKGVERIISEILSGL